MADRSWRRRRLREADERYGPDHSEVVYAFSDAWTIRRPVLVSDCWREGFPLRWLGALRLGPWAVNFDG